MSRAEPESRHEAAGREATRDPIFLFQRRRWSLVREPEGYVTCHETGDVVPEGDPDGEPLTLDQLRERECVLEWWVTESVYLSREAGEVYGRARDYNYRDGWRVFCVCAEGALAGLLKQHGEAAWVADRAGRAEAARVDAAHVAAIDCGRPSCSWCHP